MLYPCYIKLLIAVLNNMILMSQHSVNWSKTNIVQRNRDNPMWYVLIICYRLWLRTITKHAEPKP